MVNSLPETYHCVPRTTGNGPHNRPHSDRGQGEGGGVNRNDSPDDDSGNENGRFEWTSELRDDLMECYEASEPRRRGYMARMHNLWCQKHPIYNLTKQHLRDYSAYLRRIGYVRAPDQVEPEGADRHQIEPDDPVICLNPPQPCAFEQRRPLHRRKPPKQQEYLEAELSLVEKLREEVDILTLNNALYHHAELLTFQARKADEGRPVETINRRLQKVQIKIKAARQYASRVQCVLEYINTGRPFTPKVRQIARQLRRNHHTLNEGVLNTTKQHCLDRIRMLTVVKQKLEKKSRWTLQNIQFSRCPSRLFQPASPVIENPPNAQDVENFWKDIYEEVKPLNEDTPALALFESFCRRTQNPVQQQNPITPEEVQSSLKRTNNYTVPESDDINNF